MQTVRRASNYRVIVNGQVVTYMRLHLTLSRFRSCTLVVTDIAEGDDVLVYVDDVLLLTGVVVTSSREASNKYVAYVETAVYKTQALCQTQVWNNNPLIDTVNTIVQYAGDIKVNARDIATLPAMRFQVRDDMSVGSALDIVTQTCVGYGLPHVTWWFDEYNVLNVGKMKDHRGDIAHVESHNVLCVNTYNWEAWSQVVHWNSECTIDNPVDQKQTKIITSMVEYESVPGTKDCVRITGDVISTTQVSGLDNNARENTIEQEIAKNKEYIVSQKGYILENNEDLVIEILQGSSQLQADVKSRVLRKGVIGAIYEEEKKRWKVNDGLPSIPSTWVRSLLSAVLIGGATGVGSWLAIFASVVSIPAALVITGIGFTAGAIGGAVSPNPNSSVGRGQITQGAFNDVISRMQVDIERFMKLLVERGYIKHQYEVRELDDVNLFNSWVSFFNATRSKYLEDFFVLAILCLNVQEAYERGVELNVHISDVEKHRTIDDAIQFGIARYKGIDLRAVQESAGVLQANGYVSDARYSVLERFTPVNKDDVYITEDNAQYIKSVYSVMR